MRGKRRVAVSAAAHRGCRSAHADDWNCRSVLKSCAISRTRYWNGGFQISSSVLFWYLRLYCKEVGSLPFPKLQSPGIVEDAPHKQPQQIDAHKDAGEYGADNQPLGQGEAEAPLLVASLDDDGTEQQRGDPADGEVGDDERGGCAGAAREQLPALGLGLERMPERARRRLVLQTRLEILRDLPHQPLERQLLDRQLRALLVFADLVQRHGAGHNRCGFFTPPVAGAAFVASCFRGALPLSTCGEDWKLG
ncbi:hypothetical protein U9M48_029856 [Paspalum notatum var. saurae]|uniref:Uncharacterized protein n=1 Tax=Paspalum notatum var. saurae TaxID=547442 RepID=A0AAQ3U473_PASNO